MTEAKQGIQSIKEQFRKALGTVSALKKVEETIRTKFDSRAENLTEISNYLFNLGGKRVRPALALLISKAFGTEAPEEKLINAAAGIELIHMATLLHDDIIDKSPIRRGQVTPSIKYGLPPALLAGDFLLVRAFGICGMLDTEVIKATEKACIELTEGETLEEPLYLKDFTLDDSILIAELKTASLFSLASFVGAYYSPYGKTCSKMLLEFGSKLGIAFQILDDVLDITSDKETLGKEPFGDLRERKPSVVNVLWLDKQLPESLLLKEAPIELDQFVDKDLKQEKLADEEHRISKAKDSIITSGCIETAKGLAREYANQAIHLLNEAYKESDAIIAPNQSTISARKNLMTLIEYTLSRME